MSNKITNLTPWWIQAIHWSTGNRSCICKCGTEFLAVSNDSLNTLMRAHLAISKSCSGD